MAHCAFGVKVYILKNATNCVTLTRNREAPPSDGSRNGWRMRFTCRTVTKLAVASTGRDIRFYDTTTASQYIEEYCLFGWCCDNLLYNMHNILTIGLLGWHRAFVWKIMSHINHGKTKVYILRKKSIIGKRVILISWYPIKAEKEKRLESNTKNFTQYFVCFVLYCLLTNKR